MKFFILFLTLAGFVIGFPSEKPESDSEGEVVADSELPDESSDDVASKSGGGYHGFGGGLSSANAGASSQSFK
jgi:hypothetical protein